MKTRRPRFVLLTLPSLLAVGAIASTATADVQFQPEPCVITLAPQYTADAYGQLSAAIPESAIQCPGFTFDLNTMSLAVDFTNAAGERGPNLADKTKAVYDPVTNSIVQSEFLELISNGPTAGPFTGIAPTYVKGSFWLDSPTDASKHYRLVLGSPFSIVRASAVTPSCSLNLAAKYAYRWNQEPYFVIPDSAVQCTGFTYNSNDYDTYVSFSSRVVGAGSLSIDTRRVFSSATGTYSTVKELRLTSYKRPGQASLARENGVTPPAGSDGWTWGRFTQGPDGALVSPVGDVTLNRLLAPEYRLTLAKSFAIKRATDVTAKVRRRDGDAVAVSIHADRNWSFQNGSSPTHRRQTVMPTTPADHVVLKRNGKTLRRITLSPYGNATITVPASTPKRTYTVTMVETDDNFAGSASFKA